MNKILLAATLAIVSLLSSCNTTIGLGRDMRILGGNMENAANRKLQGADDNGGGGNYNSNNSGGAPVY